MIELLVDEGADLEYESDDYSMLELAKESNYTKDVAEYIKENL